MGNREKEREREREREREKERKWGKEGGKGGREYVSRISALEKINAKTCN